ncbi:MAG TPA: hypothetical protein VFL83_19575 [Anaeromyxobacter sp.]|nr:hypothetical protein [Anaeromyxobacter sp.]
MTKKTLAIVAAAVVCACGGGKDSGSPAGDPNAGDPNAGEPSAGEPNGSMVAATPLTLGTPVVATLPDVNDYDFYKFTVPARGATVHVQTFDQGGTGCNSVDTYVEVYDSTPVSDPIDAWVTDSDDTGINTCEDFTVTLPEGTNYVAISGWSGFPFSYTVKVSIP